MKQCITEDMKIQDEWYKNAKDMNLEELPNFLKDLMENYGHDYGTICHAIAAGAVATMWAMNNHENGNITGYQAGCLLWEVIKHWNYESNKTGLKMIDYDKFLYPQYDEYFDKTISKDIWEAIQKEAKENLNKENDLVCEEVRQHWQSIIDGKIPFGYKIEEK